MNNPFDYSPSPECEQAFRELITRIETLKNSSDNDNLRFCRELEGGKMLGVLVAEDQLGTRHTLYAFSGQIGKDEFLHPWFVEPVFDYLQPNGYFKTHEADISRQNQEIDSFEKGLYAEVSVEFLFHKQNLDAEVKQFQQKCRISKQARDEKRKSENLSDEERAALIRQSQFEKAELHRLKKRCAAELEPYATKFNEAKLQLEGMKEKRHQDSEVLQQWLFSNFRILNARGETRCLSEIFKDTPMGIPPSGAGECCAPKLLQAAYVRRLHPVAIAEYWYGRPKEGEVRIHGEHYPACRGKCLPVLKWMLQGLEVEPPLNEEGFAGYTIDPKIIFENQYFCVVDKPSGMLSVPGKGNAYSVQQWLEDKYGADRMVKVAHRLDQDTSGLIIAAFGDIAYRVIQRCFASRTVKKTYAAELDGDYKLMGKPSHGRINLPLSPDYLDRPRQRVDSEDGKKATTDFEFISAKDGRSRVIFYPLTGRTHQLRVHSASEMGLGMPIAGDRLYGRNRGKNAPRLMLHAQKLEFLFPIDQRFYSFESSAAF